MNEGTLPNRRQEKTGYWILAILLSLLLHVAVIVGVRQFRWTRAERLPAEEPVVEMVFAPDDSRPDRFTELPDEAADEAPEQADLLSNVQSRARDETTDGGDSALPRSEGIGEMPQIAMERAPTGFEGTALEEPTRRDPAVSTPPADAAPDESPAEKIETGFTLDAPREPKPERALLSVIDSIASFDWSDRRRGRRGPERDTRGADDLQQEMLDNARGSAELVGDYSLDTAAWVYGFWMKRFSRQLEEHWYAPYAFRIGLLDGWTLVEMVVDRTGRLVSAEVVDEKGHASLAEASLTAIRTAAPYEPFPADLPEPDMTLRIKMIYNGPPRLRGD